MNKTRSPFLVSVVAFLTYFLATLGISELVFATTGTFSALNFTSIEFVGYAGLLILTVFFYQTPIQSWFGRHKAVTYLIPIALAIGCLIIAHGIHYIWAGQINAEAQSTKPVLAIVQLCLIAPIIEEIVFRGIILESFLKREKVVIGVLVSSLLFAVIHVYPILMVKTFVFGIVSALLFAKYRKIGLCILLHIAFNFIGWVLGHYSYSL